MKLDPCPVCGSTAPFHHTQNCEGPPAAALRSKILDAEERAANWLSRGNELKELGKHSAAEKAYDKATHWLTRANKLRRW